MNNGNGKNGSPLTPAGNGRDGGGKFAAGNRLGRGNPLNRRMQKLRSSYIRAVSAKDMKEIVQAVVTAAKAGDIQAAKEVCDRILGRPQPQDILERLEALESAVSQRNSEVRR